MRSTMPPQLLSVDAVAELLGVPKATVYRWRSQGDGPPGLRVGRHLRYRAEDVARWIDDRVERPDAVQAVRGPSRTAPGGAKSSARRPA